jgi:hypothetical protein
VFKTLPYTDAGKLLRNQLLNDWTIDCAWVYPTFTRIPILVLL